MLATREALPTIFDTCAFTELEISRAMGTSVNVGRILRGAKPADLQVVRIELVLNSKTEKPLGLTLPASPMVRADEMIE